MATQPPPASAAPAITNAGLTALAAQLDADLAAVPATSPLRPLIADHVGRIKDVLAQGTADPGGWVAFLKPQFQTLTANLKAALALGDGKTGACFYSNPDGCVQSTQDQCTALGGDFHPGATCP
jgi:hypothetical protein